MHKKTRGCAQAKQVCASRVRSVTVRAAGRVVIAVTDVDESAHMGRVCVSQIKIGSTHIEANDTRGGSIRLVIRPPVEPGVPTAGVRTSADGSVFGSACGVRDNVKVRVGVEIAGSATEAINKVRVPVVCEGNNDKLVINGSARPEMLLETIETKARQSSGEPGVARAVNSGVIAVALQAGPLEQGVGVEEAVLIRWVGGSDRDLRRVGDCSKIVIVSEGNPVVRESVPLAEEKVVPAHGVWSHAMVKEDGVVVCICACEAKYCADVLCGDSGDDGILLGGDAGAPVADSVVQAGLDLGHVHTHVSASSDIDRCKPARDAGGSVRAIVCHGMDHSVPVMAFCGVGAPSVVSE